MLLESQKKFENDMSNMIKELESKLSEISKKQSGSKMHVDALLDLAWELGLTDEKRARDLTNQAKIFV